METRPKCFNEVFEQDGTVRGPYRLLLETLESIGTEAFVEKAAAAAQRLGELGATFPLPGAPEDENRVLPADWVPRIVPREHWMRLSAGLLQRGRAINAWLADLYNGEQVVVPQEIVRSSPFYRHHQLRAPSVTAPIHVYGPDLIHMGDGEYVVLEDNVRVPSGVAYSAAIRHAGKEALSELFSSYRVSDIDDYYGMLRASLEGAAPPNVKDPVIALVTSGPEDPAFFEHRRIAEACGLRLLTLEGCHVQGDEIRANSDGRRIDVIYRRFDESDMTTGLPQLEEVSLAGKVNLVNALGAGVADDKAVFCYVPTMIERYLGEKPILRNAPTFSLFDPEQRAEVLERLPELVVKPRDRYGGKGLVVGPEASREDLDRIRREIELNPINFVAQECLEFSTHILGNPAGGSPSDEAFIDLRAFVLPAVSYVMLGGLTRVASPGTRVVNSSAGGSFKDTWILDAAPEVN